METAFNRYLWEIGILHEKLIQPSLDQLFSSISESLEDPSIPRRLYSSWKIQQIKKGFKIFDVVARRFKHCRSTAALYKWRYIRNEIRQCKENQYPRLPKPKEIFSCEESFDSKSNQGNTSIHDMAAKILNSPSQLPEHKVRQHSMSMNLNIVNREQQNRTNMYARLYNDAENKRAKIELAKKRQNQIEQSECTFAPAFIASSPNMIVPPTAPFERLTDTSNAKIREIAYERYRDDRDMDQCTFQPNLSQSKIKKYERMSRSTNQLYKENEVRHQAQRARELQKSIKETEECTFRPAILSSTPKADTSPFERLYEDSKFYEMERRRLQIVADEKDVEQCTFVPELVSTAKYRDRMDFGIPVHEKLYADADRREQQHRDIASLKERQSTTTEDQRTPDQIYQNLKNKIRRERGNNSQASNTDEFTFMPRSNALKSAYNSRTVVKQIHRRSTESEVNQTLNTSHVQESHGDVVLGMYSNERLRLNQSGFK